MYDLRFKGEGENLRQEEVLEERQKVSRTRKFKEIENCFQAVAQSGGYRRRYSEGGTLLMKERTQKEMLDCYIIGIRVITR